MGKLLPFGLLVITLTLQHFGFGQTVPERRCALVIGVDNYVNLPSLRSNINDADDISAVLSQLGYGVVTLHSPTHKNLKRTLDSMIRRLKDSSIFIVYFSGHGISYNGENYLLLSDEDSGGREKVLETAYSVTSILKQTQEHASAVTSILLLDACRTPVEDERDRRRHHRSLMPKKMRVLPPGNDMSTGNSTTLQYDGKRYDREVYDRGLTAVCPSSDALIGFAATTSSAALVRPNDRNSIYTAALLRYLKIADLSIYRLLAKVNQDVIEETHHMQIPCFVSTLEREISLNNSVNLPPPSADKP